MTRIILKQDQYYMASEGGVKFGKKGATVDAEASFLKLIEGYYDLAKGEKTDVSTPSAPEKSLDQLNKTELLEKVKDAGHEITEEIELKTKAELIQMLMGK